MSNTALGCAQLCVVQQSDSHREVDFDDQHCLAKRPAMCGSSMAMVSQELTAYRPAQLLKPPPHPRGSNVVYSPLPKLSTHPILLMYQAPTYANGLWISYQHHVSIICSHVPTVLEMAMLSEYDLEDATDSPASQGVKNCMHEEKIERSPHQPR